MGFTLSASGATDGSRPARTRRRVVALGAAVGAVGICSGVGVAVASTGAVPARTHDAITRNLTPVNLSTSGGTRVVVESVTLPTGNWVLSSKESIVNFGPSDYVRCGLVAGGTDINWATSMVGDQTLPGSRGPGVYVATVSEIGSVTTVGPLQVSVQCDHDTSTPSGDGTPYIDADSALWAHRSASLINTGQ